MSRNESENQVDDQIPFENPVISEDNDHNVLDSLALLADRTVSTAGRIVSSTLSSFGFVSDSSLLDMLTGLQTGDMPGEPPAAPVLTDAQQQSRGRNRLQQWAGSTDEFDRSRAEQIQALLDSDNATDRANGESLVRMLGNEQADLATSILSLPEAQRRELFTMLGNPAQREQGERLAGMLGEPFSSESIAASRVLGLLAGNAEERADGQALMRMLGSAEQRQLAQNLLSANLENTDIHRFLQMRTGTANERHQAAALEGLMQAGETRVAENILKMLGEPGQRADGERLLQMLNNPGAEADLAKAIASLDSADHRHQMLELHAAGRHPEAMNELARLIRSDNPSDPDRATRLLDMLAGNPQDRADGQTLLGLLNNQDTRNDALRMVLHPHDRRHELLALYANPQTRAGTTELMNMLDGSRRARQGAHSILDDLTTGRNVPGARQLVEQLGDPDRRLFAQTILTQLADANSRRVMQDLLAAGHNRAAEALQTMLNSSDDSQRIGALHGIEMLAGRPLANASSRAFIDMLSNPETRARAQGLLQHSENAGQLQQLMDLISNPASAAVGNQIADRLIAGGEQRQSARQLLRMLNTPSGEGRGAPENKQDAGTENPDPTANADAQRLLRMMGDPATRDLAWQVINSHASGSARSNLINLLNNRDTRELGRNLMNLLSANRTSDEAHSILSLRSPRDMEAMLQLRETEGLSTAYRNLLHMTQRNGGAETLLELRRTNPEVANALLQQLNHPDRADDARYTLAGNSPAQVLQLQEINNANPVAARYLRSQLAQGEQNAVAARELLNMRANPQSRQVANRLVDMMGQGGAAQENAGALLRLQQARTGAVDMVPLLEALSNPQRRATADVIRGLLQGSDEDAPQQLRILSQILAGSDSEGNQRFISMLENPATQRIARNLLSAMRDAESIISAVPVVQQSAALRDMLNTPDGQQTRSAIALVNALSSSDAATVTGARALVAQLENADTAAGVRRALGRIQGDNRISALAQLLGSPDAARVAHGRELLTALSGDDNGRAGGAAAALELHSQGGRARVIGGAGENSGDQLMRVLAHAQHGPALRAALQNVQDANQLRLLLDMLSNPGTAATGTQFLNMLRNNDQRDIAQSILRNAQNQENADRLLSLHNNPQTREHAQLLLQMMQSEDKEVQDGARSVLALMQRGATGPADARALLDMLADSRTNAQALELIDAIGRVQDAHRLLELAQNQNQRRAYETVMGMIETGDFEQARGVNHLFSMLASNDPSVRNEGQRLLNLMNSYYDSNAGVRELMRQLPRLEPQGTLGQLRRGG